MLSTSYNAYILNELSTYFVEYNEFNCLLGTDCVLSGSFVLKHINNDEFKCSDIDLYINIANGEKILSIIKFITGENYLEVIVEEKKYNNNNNKYSDNTIVDVIQYINPTLKKSIDIIICCDIIDTIDDFDFNIVKNYYNGTETYITYPENVYKKKEKITLYRSDITNWKKRLGRVEKYKTRGYNLTVDVEKEKNNYTTDIIYLKHEISILYCLMIVLLLIVISNNYC